MADFKEGGDNPRPHPTPPHPPIREQPPKSPSWIGLSKNVNFEANINENRISNKRFQKLLGVTFHNQLNFNHYISKIFKTASNKFVLLIIYIPFNTCIFDSYFLSQFNYCPLIRMSNNKSINKKNQGFTWKSTKVNILCSFK